MTNRFIKLSGNFQRTEKESYKYIKDGVTGLIWQRETLGPMTWYYAMELNKKGWRIPTLQELESIRDINKYRPCCDPIFEAKSTVHWSSSPIVYGNDYAWNVSFYDGYVVNDGKHNNSHVRLVRGKSKYLEELHK